MDGCFFSPFGLSIIILVHPASAYPLEKKAFHLLDEIRADTKVRPYNHSLTLTLSQRERGSGDRSPWPNRLITLAKPIEQQPRMLEKKVRTCRMIYNFRYRKNV